MAQFMSVSRWLGCMDAMTPSCLKRGNVGRVDDLRVLDAIAGREPRQDRIAR